MAQSLGNANAVFAQSQQLLLEQERVGQQSAQISAKSSAMQAALQSLQTVASNIGN